MGIRHLGDHPALRRLERGEERLDGLAVVRLSRLSRGLQQAAVHPNLALLCRRGGVPLLLPAERVDRGAAGPEPGAVGAPAGHPRAGAGVHPDRDSGRGAPLRAGIRPHGVRPVGEHAALHRGAAVHGLAGRALGGPAVESQPRLLRLRAAVLAVFPDLVLGRDSANDPRRGGDLRRRYRQSRIPVALKLGSEAAPGNLGGAAGGQRRGELLVRHQRAGAVVTGPRRHAVRSERDGCQRQADRTAHHDGADVAAGRCRRGQCISQEPAGALDWLRGLGGRFDRGVDDLSGVVPPVRGAAERAGAGDAVHRVEHCDDARGVPAEPDRSAAVRRRRRDRGRRASEQPRHGGQHPAMGPPSAPRHVQPNPVPAPVLHLCRRGRRPVRDRRADAAGDARGPRAFPGAAAAGGAELGGAAAPVHPRLRGGDESRDQLQGGWEPGLLPRGRAAPRRVRGRPARDLLRGAFEPIRPGEHQHGRIRLSRERTSPSSRSTQGRAG